MKKETTLLLAKIKKDLADKGSVEGQKGFQRFFKNKVNSYGLKSADIGKIYKKYKDRVNPLLKAQVFELCEKLYSTDLYEESALATSFAYDKAAEYEMKDFALFENWLTNYINNWAKCDVFCTSVVAYFLDKYPSYITKVKSWTGSKNIWLKRASAVSLIPAAKKGLYLDNVFEIAIILLTDSDDMVQKGYGWLLKEASRKNQKKVLNFVVKNKQIMPRTALRYAIELMPADMKARAMSKA